LSLRVHKMAGWGFPLRKAHPEIPPLRKFALGEDLPAGFLRFVAANQDEILRLTAIDVKKISPPDVVDKYVRSNLDMEILAVREAMKKWRHGKPSSFVHRDRDALLFQPLSCPGWRRWDDDLDWIEEHHFHGARNRTQVLKTGIWPHDHWMVRFRDPPADMVAEFKAKPEFDLPGHVRVDDKGIVALATGEWNRFVGRWDPKLLPQEAGARLGHFKKDFRPAIPTGVVALVLWSGMAKEPEAFLDALRPMVRVWWE